MSVWLSSVLSHEEMRFTWTCLPLSREWTQRSDSGLQTSSLILNHDTFEWRVGPLSVTSRYGSHSLGLIFQITIQNGDTIQVLVNWRMPDCIQVSCDDYGHKLTDYASCGYSRLYQRIRYYFIGSLASLIFLFSHPPALGVSDLSYELTQRKTLSWVVLLNHEVFGSLFPHRGLDNVTKSIICWEAPNRLWGIWSSVLHELL